MSLFDELKRRNVIRSGTAYIVLAWLVVQVIETVGPAFGFGDAAMRIAVVVLAIGFVPALLFAWAFQLTPGGVRREVSAAEQATASPAESKRLDRAIIVVLTLALCLFAVDKFLLDSAPQEDGPTAEPQTSNSVATQPAIAVLPFQNMSNDPANEFFSDGVAEEILTALSSVRNLRVIARDAAFAYERGELTAAELAERLGASYVLDGSVRKAGNRVRITARLVDATSNTQIWSDAYDRTLDDVFALQDDVALAIVEELRVRFPVALPEVGTGTVAVDADAHAAYLRGKYFRAQETATGYKHAIEALREAVSFAPDFADAHAELAIALLKAEPEELSWDELIAEVTRHSTIALTLAPDSHLAQAAQGRLLWNLGRDEEALTYYRRALELNPNFADAWRWLAQQDHLVGLEEAFVAAEKAARLAPLSQFVYFYVYKLLLRSRFEEAERAIEHFSALDPLGGRLIRGTLDSVGTNWATMILAILEAASTAPDKMPAGMGSIWSFPYRLAAVGLEQEALAFAEGRDPELIGFLVDGEQGIALARRQLAEDKRSVNDRVMGSLLALAGQYAEARPYLERQFADKNNRFSSPSQFEAFLAEQLYAACKATGDAEGAAAVLKALEENVERLRAAGITGTDWAHSVDYQAGIAAYLRGDRERGLALLAEAAEKGFWIGPPSDFQLEMFSEPAFKEILAGQAERQARERRKLLDVVCDDNPYEALWQPLPETCANHDQVARKLAAPGEG